MKYLFICCNSQVSYENFIIIFGGNPIEMSFCRIACFRDFRNFSRFAYIRKFSTMHSDHGETMDISRNSKAMSRAFVPLRSIPASDLGFSILADSNKDIALKVVREGEILSPKMVFAAKILSLSSSAFGLAMIPIISQLAARKPGTGNVAAVVDSFFILYAFTPILLHQILVKRYIVDLYYNPNTEIFTSIHFGFFLGKRALRFRAEDVIDSNRSPDMFKLWFPLATVVIHGKPLMLSLNEETYGDVEIFKKLTKNIKLTS
uniref:Transmembrane protein 70 homolog, mitochondrial n=1 Tax=Onchocerca volvulus TaxID=6282 RepID=A0A2K6VYJ2_ONCVO